MNIAKLGAVVVTCALFFVGVDSPASAASVATNVFLTNLMPNIDFLDGSSRFALTNSKSAHVRDFARSEAKEQTVAINALEGWIKTDPVAVASAAGADQVVTGRSVAVDGQDSQAVDNRLALGQEDLDSLEGLNGREFDAQYTEKQLDALTQIQTDYRNYLAKGDDPHLLAIAKRELPKIDRRLAMLKKI